MAFNLFVFPDPLDARCELEHDTGGWTLIAVPAVNPEGVPGQVFAIPDTTANANGAWLTITATGKAQTRQHGFVFMNDGNWPWPWPATQQAAWSADIFVLSDATTTLPRLVANGKFLAQDIP